MTANPIQYMYTLLHIVDDGVLGPGIVAEVAARYGYRDIVRDMVDRGATNYDVIAKIAAQYGHRNIISYLVVIDGPNLDYDYIASGARRGGYNELADEISHMRGSNTYAYDRYTSPSTTQYP